MSELSALLKQREAVEANIARRDMALKLAENAEFKKLILQEFCVEECARYAQNSANPALNAEARSDSLQIAQAAGHFRRWLSVVVQMGDQGVNNLEQIDEAIQELRREGGDE